MSEQNKKNIFSTIGSAIKNFYVEKIQKPFGKLPHKVRKAIFGYVFVLPFIVGLIIFGAQPILKSIRMALADVYQSNIDELTQEVIFTAEGFGFTQFKLIFTENPDHLEAITAVLVDVAIVVPLVLIFSLILSLLLNRKIKGVKVFRMIFFIPVILLSGNLLTYFESYNLLVVPGMQGGAIQGILEFYLPAQVSDIIMQAFSVVILILWLSGVQTLIFLAGLQKTNKPVYEAAAIDGATKWEMFWKITFPSLIPLMIINIVYTAVIYSSLGNELTGLISSTANNIKFGRDYASALAWILFMIEIVVIGVYTLILQLANKHYD